MGIYLSLDNTVTRSDRLIGYSLYPAANAGEVLNRKFAVSIPNIPAGRYYVGAIADYNNYLYEKNEQNNCFTAGSPVTIL